MEMQIIPLGAMPQGVPLPGYYLTFTIVTSQVTGSLKAVERLVLCVMQQSGQSIMNLIAVLIVSLWYLLPMPSPLWMTIVQAQHVAACLGQELPIMLLNLYKTHFCHSSSYLACSVVSVITVHLGTKEQCPHSVNLGSYRHIVSHSEISLEA